MTNPPAAFYVYTLHDPRDVERILYVGMGRDTGRLPLATARQVRSRVLKAFGAERAIAPIRIVAADLTKGAAIALEIELIAKYGRECDGGPLLNRALGGPGAPGRILDARSREKMAASHRGQRISKEHAAKFSAAGRAARLARRAAKLRPTPESAEPRIP